MNDHGAALRVERSRASARVPIRRTGGSPTKEGSGGSQHFLVITTTFFALYVPSGMWVDGLEHLESTGPPLVGQWKRTPVHRIWISARRILLLLSLLLVHKDFNNNLLHHQNNLKTQPMLNLDSRKGSSPSNPIPRTALRAHSELFSACDPAFTCSLCAEC